MTNRLSPRNLPQYSCIVCQSLTDCGYSVYVFGAITDSQQKVRHKVVIYTFYRKLSASVSRTFFVGQDESKTTVLYCPNHHHGSEISEKSERASNPCIVIENPRSFHTCSNKTVSIPLLRLNCKNDLGYIFLTLVLDISVNISHGRAVLRWRVGPVSATSPKAYSLACRWNAIF